MTDPVSVTQLLPCPFCGGAGEMMLNQTGGYRVAYVRCVSCRVQADSVVRIAGDRPAEPDAITAWNTRPTPDTHPAATGSVRESDGQDRKFAFRDGQFVNRVSGEPIPHDEPIIIFRARDRHAIPVLREYLSMATDDHHRQAIRERLAEFSAYRDQHPERMKEPGITHHIALAAAPTPDVAASEAGEVERLREAVKLTIADAAYHLRKYRPHCLEALEAALTTQGGGGMSRLSGVPECGDHLDSFPCRKCAAETPSQCKACWCVTHERMRATLAQKDTQNG